MQPRFHPPEYLYPFALRAAEVLPGRVGGLGPLAPPPAPPPPSNPQQDPFVSIRTLWTFPDDAAAYGLVPRALVPALLELGIGSDLVGECALALAHTAQLAITIELAERARGVSRRYNARALYRELVLGVPPPLSPPQ